MPRKRVGRVEKRVRSGLKARRYGPGRKRLFSPGLVLLVLLSLFFASSLVLASDGLPQARQLTVEPTAEPISVIGHGGFFDAHGNQIVPTEDFVQRAQEWYRNHLEAALVGEQRVALEDFESRLMDGLKVDGQSRLALKQRSLSWLLQRSSLTVAPARMRGKIKALEFRLRWQLAPSDDQKHLLELHSFEPDAGTLERLQTADAELELTGSLEGPGFASLVTTNSGQDYVNECIANDVPIPPAINDLSASGWTSLGFIPTGDQFITGTPAELRSFENSDGMCLALPRYNNASLSTVTLDGVICLSKITSKVCIWDNQMNGTTFLFPAGDVIPIGFTTSTTDPRYQAGGAEIENNPVAGVCTDCHAGENPYIVHPQTILETSTGTPLGAFGAIDDAPTNLPTFAPDRYDPIVAGSWPQNALSMNDAYVPPACVGCHTLGGQGGRFPHLSDELPGYCNTILNQAIATTGTMPPGSPGSGLGSTGMATFLGFCNMDPTSGPSDRGDPHLRTVDGVSYDFQAAGEFSALINPSTGFELQTRQTPVTTTFNPGPNGYTGLASCASLNTAAAVRLGGHRVSVQPSITGSDCRRQKIVLYLDGRETVVPSGGIDLGNGNRIAKISNGYEMRASDGTRVLITDHFWASQGYSYLNIEVLDTPARLGTLGPILGNDWLPRAPNGSSFGPMPAALTTRDYQLNVAFADAWRVTGATSLFEYAPGTSTANFTDRSWPPPSGTSCSSWEVIPFPGCGPREAVQPLPVADAQRACVMFREDKDLFEECVFDVRVMGNAQMAEGLAISLAARKAPCATCEPVPDQEEK